MCLKLFIAGSAHCGPWVKYHSPPVFVNRVLLKHRHINSFTYCLRLLFCRVEYLPRIPYGPQSIRDLLSGSLREKFVACSSIGRTEYTYVLIWEFFKKLLPTPAPPHANPSVSVNTLMALRRNRSSVFSQSFTPFWSLQYLLIVIFYFMNHPI